MPSEFAIKIKLRAGEQYFRNFRIAAGNMRQRSENSTGTAKEIQRICGDIEKSLYNARQILERR